jgi:F0F1-type ATP synthase membrane subunit b/b'
MSTTSNDLAKQGQDFVDNAADRVHKGISGARQTATKIGETAADQAQTILERGIDSAKAAAQRVRDSATQASESLVTHTKENPVKAILVAAASGALLLTLFNALSRSRD